MSAIWRTQFDRKALCRCALLAAGILLGSAAGAHDFWIEPEDFRPSVGERVPLRLRVGEHFKGEPVLYAPAQFERYVYIGPTGEGRIDGTLGDDPAGAVPIEATGLYIIGYYSKKFDVTFDSISEFENHLTTEGLERHLLLAKRRFRLRKGVVEIYTRCAKTLIHSGDRAPRNDRVLGFPLELIAERNPYAGARTLPVRLLYRGKPLEGALVVAFNKQQPLDKLKLRSDNDGRAVLELTRPGTWLITSVHMIPTSLLSRADWESFWASLTFELPRTPAPPR